MKKFIYAVVALMLVASMLVAGCATAQPQTASVTGEIQEIDKDSVTITFEELDEKVLNITSDTEILLEGRVCSLDELLAADKVSDLYCTAIYDPATGDLIYLDVKPAPEPATEQGSLESIDKDSVTIITDKKQERTFDITPSTQISLEGVYCTFEEVSSLDNAKDLGCTIIYDPLSGEVIYVDVYESSQLASATGEVENVNRAGVTITTGNNQQESYDITSETKILLQGRVCSIQELAAATEAGDYTCTVVYDPVTGDITFLDVYTSPEVASETGMVEDVSKGQVTITTEENQKESFDIVPDTQILLEGKACSISELLTALDKGDYTCTVVYDPITGDIEVLDVQKAPDLEMETGSLEKIANNKVTITTDENQTETFEITPKTTLIKEGKACTIAELQSAASAEDFYCVIVYDPVTGEIQLLDVY